MLWLEFCRSLKMQNRFGTNDCTASFLEHKNFVTMRRNDQPVVNIKFDYFF